MLKKPFLKDIEQQPWITYEEKESPKFLVCIDEGQKI